MSTAPRLDSDRHCRNFNLRNVGLPVRELLRPVSPVHEQYRLQDQHILPGGTQEEPAPEDHREFASYGMCGFAVLSQFFLFFVYLVEA